MTHNTHTTLSIEGMSCASCVGRVEKTLSALPGVSDVSVNLASEQARLSVDSPDRLQDAAQALDTLGYPVRTARITLNIASMSCASCVGRVDKALADVPGVLSVTVNLAAETAAIEYLEGAVTPAELMAATSAIGYPAEIAEANASQSRVERKAEEADALHVLSVGVIDAPPLALFLDIRLQAVDVWADELALVEQADRLRRRQDAVGVPRVDVVGDHHLADRGDEIHEQQQRARPDRELVAL